MTDDNNNNDNNNKSNENNASPRQHTTDNIENSIAAQVSMWHKAENPEMDNKQETDVNNNEKDNSEQPKNTK
tara:strand:+ start:71 stop:286 length:216 start_codon:yes stop_codon:yes gene_type:complete